MTIQFNTDNKVIISEKLRTPLISLISEELSRFSHQITRVEVHLSDENGDKEGLNDKRCMIEVRLAGMKPTAVTNHANTHEQAVEGAVDKLKTSLDTITGRMRNHLHY
jgi:ribosome-associated translation inhibitor RaiA